MAVDTDYLDDLMKSIEPAIYPDGVPGEENTDEDEFVQETESNADEVMDYDSELASIPEKGASIEPETISSPVEEVLGGEESVEDISGDLESTEQVAEVFDEAEEKVLEAEEIDLENMSEEEIDAMLNAAKSSAEDEVTPISESDDITDILAMLDGDSDIADIKNTLDKSDNNIALDASALDQPSVEIPDFDEEAEEEAKPEKKKKKSKKKKQDDAEETAEETSGEKKKKKGGLFSKLFNALTEEVPDENDIPEKSETGVTDENAQILAELDSEDKGKKKKKKKDKKSKGKNKDAQSQGDERDIREKSEDEDGDGKEKDKKQKKPKKEKKQKIKKVEEPQKNEKKLPKKRVRNTFILCLSILAAILILVIFGTEYLIRKQARFAFDNEEYEAVYSDLYGEKLSDSDNEIYQKSKTIMLMQRKLSSYENYMQLGMRPEALNAVLEGYEMYPEVKEKADELGVTEQVVAVYAKILDALASFGLTTQDAEEINGYTSKVQYNKRILSIANNIPFEYEGANADEQSTDEVDDSDQSLMQDILPEEEDFLPENPEEVFQIQ